MKIIEAEKFESISSEGKCAGWKQSESSEVKLNVIAATADDTNGGNVAEPMSAASITVTIKGPGDAHQIPMQASATVSELADAFASLTARAHGDQPRLLYGGRPLKPSETLAEVMRYCDDKSALSLRVLLPPPPPPKPAPAAAEPPPSPKPAPPPRAAGSPESPPGHAAPTNAPAPPAPAGPGTAAGAPAAGGEPAWAEGLKRRVEANMRAAFWDLLDRSHITYTCNRDIIHVIQIV
jgi:hypothetical protein